jgi:intracellular sulfur oxidation DsrE/DsrF family protein
LQGSVHVAVTKNAEDVTCEFTRENVADKLRIEVVAMAASREELARYKAQCELPLASLRAIGNEAVACGVAAKKEEIAEQVVGRVRAQAFLVRLTVAATAPTSHAALREKATKVAEQVAGILF